MPGILKVEDRLRGGEKGEEMKSKKPWKLR
jgi:hypothetical protein